ncbi:substrate-binding domain-containing protein [Rhodococcus sp. T2V]|uniref:substrate-binding domain-containing protein n=1 Tax=Rhodococcus sp. T2V TaxID=3034164 RepID=UPI0023E261D9|nr:substrate-binding domain-containing protein [Rhodococcus sp. T2V]MDF3306217.1 substrate-binding domain-containing protein [Rhodococcus sp. T2V]
MKDVAAAAGVSLAAVSYAYSNSPKVSPQRRAHIYEIASQIGYTGPHIMGSSLRSGRVGAVGVMVTDSLVHALDDPSSTLLMKGIVEIGELADVALTLLPLAGGDQLITEHKSPAVRGLVDGVVIHNVPTAHPMIDVLIERGIPAVAIDSPKSSKLPYVGINDRKAGCSQMSHLLELGHRRIAVIADRLHYGDGPGPILSGHVKGATERVVQERLLGYFDACREYGVAVEDLIIEGAGGIDRSSGMQAAERILARAEVTGVVATSDVHAAAALEVLHRQQIKVPEEVSVIGFDDAPIAEMWRMTTIRQPLVEKGRRAAAMLLEQIDGTGSRRRVTLDTELVERETTGKPPIG